QRPARPQPFEPPFDHFAHGFDARRIAEQPERAFAREHVHPVELPDEADVAVEGSEQDPSFVGALHRDGRLSAVAGERFFQVTLVTISRNIGNENSRLSIRSRTPPCAGSSAPESLIPQRRLSNDSTRSPTWVVTLSMIPTSSAVVNPSATSGSSSGPRSATASTTVNARLPSAPSTVFPGLTCGMSLCRPKIEPSR